MATTSTPSFKSLLKWLNTFELSQPCEKVNDLCSGHVLQSCLATVCPEVAGPGVDPWVVVMKKLEDYCGRSLDNAVSLEQAKQGDLEHLARVVVLLLCYFVEDESVNHNVIERIMQLPLEVQQDLMSLIESGLGKVNSDALSAGNFDSGVGTTSCVASHAPTPNFEGRGLATPIRPSRHGGRSIRYRGLESPAGQRWLNSPAFSSHKKIVPKTPLFVSIMNSSKKNRSEADRGSTGEIKELQHQLTLMERKVESEKLLSVDLNTELETMAETCTSLQETNSELRLKVKSMEDKVKDLEDELLFKENRLKETESAMAKHKLEAASLPKIKVTCRELEEKTAVHESMKAQLQEKTEKLLSLELSQVEKDMELKRLTIALELKLRELQYARESVERSHNSLMEVSQERDDLSRRIKHLEREKLELEAIKHQRAEQLEKLSGQLAATEDKLESVTATSKENLEQLDAACNAQELWKQQVKCLEKENAEFQARLERAVEEHCSHKQQMSDKIHALESAKVNLQAKLAKMNDEFDTLKRINSDLQARLDASQEEHESYKVSAESEYQAKLKAIHNQHSEKVQALDEAMAELQARLEGAIEEHSSHKQQVGDKVQALESAKVKLQTELDTVYNQHELFKTQKNDELDTLKRVNSDLQSRLEAAHEELESYKISAESEYQAKLEATCNQHSEKVQALDEAMAELHARLEGTVKEHTSHKQQMSNKVEVLESAKVNIQTKLANMNDELDTLKRVNSDLQARLDASQEEHESYKISAESEYQAKLKVIHNQHSEKVQALDEAMAELKARLEGTVKEHTSYEQQMSDKIQALESAKVKLRTELDDVYNQHKLFKTQKNDELDILKRVNSDLQARLDAAQEEHESYKISAESEYQAKLKAIHNQHSEKVQALDEAMAELQARLETESEEHSSHCSDLNARMAFLQAENAQLNNQLRFVDNQHSEKVQALDEAMAGLQARLETVSEEHSSHCSDLNARMAFLQAENAQLNNQLRFVERELKEGSITQELQRSGTAPRISNITNTQLNSTRTSPTDCSMLTRTGSNENRVGELQRRNKMTLPHLKSSYPIEMQTKPESPSASNETIKNGSDQNSKSAQSSTGTCGSTAFTVSFDHPENPSRKRGREFDRSVSSPPASYRRVSAPPTPDSMTVQNRVSRPTVAELKRNTLGLSERMRLRDYLDETAPTPVSTSSSFDVTFSPPKAERKIPKRFLRSVNKATKANPTEVVPEERRQTVVKKRQTRSKK